MISAILLLLSLGVVFMVSVSLGAYMAMAAFLSSMLEFSFSDYQLKFWLTFQESPTSKVMLFLTMLVWLLLTLVTFSDSIKEGGRILSFLIFTMTFVIFLFFVSNNLLALYTLFELSLIPIFVIIMGWGYQVERLYASLSMFFYTLTASLPLLVGLLIMMSSEFSSKLSIMSGGGVNFLMMAALLMAFLVKTPMFLTHLWLPKAHVEAPVYGSMILAAVLLKLGTYGLIIFIPFFSSMMFSNLVFSIAYVSCAIVSVACVRMMDLKVLIAYSSVAHMGLVIFLMLMSNLNSVGSSLGIMLGHGFSSASMFYLAYVIYCRSNSRSLIMNKSILSYLPSISLWWFLALMLNMAAPPSLNLLVELLMVMNLVNFFKVLSVGLIICILGGTAYSLIVYSSLSQTQGVSGASKELILSSESLMAMSCVIPGFLLILAPSLLF